MSVERLDNNYELIIDEKTIRRFAFALLAVQILFMFLPFALSWGWDFTMSGLKILLKHLLIWLIPIIILHEGLHGFAWAISIKGGFRHIKFGFNKDMLAPYTHCKIPLNKWTYITGGVAPLLIMGIIPALVSFCFSNAYWYCLSLFCIWSSAGDILSCYYLLKVPSTFKIQDHPDKLGFILVSTL